MTSGATRIGRAGPNRVNRLDRSRDGGSPGECGFAAKIWPRRRQVRFLPGRAGRAGAAKNLNFRSDFRIAVPPLRIVVTAKSGAVRPLRNSCDGISGRGATAPRFCVGIFRRGVPAPKFCDAIFGRGAAVLGLCDGKRRQGDTASRVAEPRDARTRPVPENSQRALLPSSLGDTGCTDCDHEG